MRKIVACLFGFSLCLAAADFWQSKPYTDWTDKELQKMLNNSPWARLYTLPLSGPIAPGLDGGGRGGRGGGTGGDGAPPPISEGGGGRGGRGGGGNAGAAPSVGASVEIVARWQSALPMKQALVRQKYGSEAVPDDAKQALAADDSGYVILLAGPMRSLVRGNAETLKQTILNATSLSAKGKGTLRPTDVQIDGSPRMMGMVFLFPRSADYSLDDKEVEFATKLGDVQLKYRFRLKDMVYNGKLAL